MWFLFFFKQKTSDEIRISDLSSGVCSSDLIAGEASILMNSQELSTAVQYKLPVKVFILNNQWMGMVRQWQELQHGSRYSESYTASLPDFIRLAEAFGLVGLRAEKQIGRASCRDRVCQYV